MKKAHKVVNVVNLILAVFLGVLAEFMIGRRRRVVTRYVPAPDKKINNKTHIPQLVDELWKYIVWAMGDGETQTEEMMREVYDRLNAIKHLARFN